MNKTLDEQPALRYSGNELGTAACTNFKPDIVKEKLVDLLQLSILLVIAGICSAIAQWVVGFSPGGFVISIILGVVGAYLGMSLASLLPIPLILPIHVGTDSFDLRWAVCGSLLLLLLLYLIRYGSGLRISARR
jgi:uncharacterized membrane protein YeaQ/YmgE (transglycosylase-associated protein family)